jgi:hypothetical protein
VTTATVRRRDVGFYWATTAIVVAEAGVGGLMDLLHQPSFVTTLVHLGYPPYFATILGTAKLLAVPVLLAPGLPRLKEWAYAGIMINMLGAAASHLGAGDPTNNIVAPLAFAAITVASWSLRPSSRRSPSTGAGE